MKVKAKFVVVIISIGLLIALCACNSNLETALNTNEDVAYIRYLDLDPMFGAGKVVECLLRDEEVVIYNYQEDEYNEEIAKISSGRKKQLSTEEYENLKETLEKCNFKNWKEEYDDAELEVEEVWVIDVIYSDGVQIHSYGSGDYPLEWQYWRKIVNSFMD